MSATLDDIGSYSAFVYALAERHKFVTGSTLALTPVGSTLGKLEGRIELEGGVRLDVWELVDFAEPADSHLQLRSVSRRRETFLARPVGAS